MCSDYLCTSLICVLHHSWLQYQVTVVGTAANNQKSQPSAPANFNTPLAM